MKSRHKDPARKRNKYKMGQFNNKQELKAAFAAKLFKPERNSNMRWKLELVHESGKVDDMYYETRQQARDARQFYKTMCDPALADVKLVDQGK